MNTKEYLEMKDNLETNVKKAKKYISSNQLTDTEVKDCPGDRPFYNGIGCIACLYPFDVFDADANECRACDP